MAGSRRQARVFCVVRPIEMWIEDPDGVPIVLVEVPADQLLRRDPRSRPPPAPA